MNQNQVALHSNSNTTSKHAPQVERNYGFCMQNQWRIIEVQLPTECPIEFKDDSNIQEIIQWKQLNNQIVQQNYTYNFAPNLLCYS